jgi:TonB-linked SusC/RagA family outer membrane protein
MTSRSRIPTVSFIALLALGVASIAALPSPGWAQTLVGLRGEVAAEYEAGDRRSVLDRQANLVVQDVRLSAALTMLSERAGVDVAFSPSLLSRHDKTTACECTDLTVSAALEVLLESSPFGYTESRGQILVHLRESPEGQGAHPLLLRLQQSRFAALARTTPQFAYPSQVRTVVHAVRQGTIVGVVTESTSARPLSGAQVFIPTLNMGVLTNAEGRFLLDAVPAGEHSIEAQIIGYASATQEVTVVSGETVTVDFSLTQRALTLGAIVATGVAAETPSTQLPFTVDRIDFSRDMPVVPSSPESLLRGRLPGVSVVQGSGQPGEEADIVLRGATSISGGQSPLVIIDGVVSGGSLAEINPQDIADIEVVKGAAAASLYGSRAQAGVINITTRRGADLGDDVTQFTLRTQYTANGLENPLGRTQHHPYKMTADGSGFVRVDGTPVETLGERVLDDGGDGSNAMRTFATNPYPASTPIIDPMEQFFSPGNQTSIYAAVAGRNGDLNYRLSANDMREEGVIRFHGGTQQRSFRLNLDHALTSNLTVSFSGYYANMEQSLIDQGVSGIFRSLTNTEPIFDLLEIDPVDGALKPVVGTPGFAATNILYTIQTDTDTRDRDRYMAGLNGRYSPLSWLSLDADFSFDRSTIEEQRFRPRGFKQWDTETLEPMQPHEGRLSRSLTRVDELTASATVSINRNLGENFTSRSRMRALYERRVEDFWTGSGSNFSVGGVPRFGLLENWTNVDSQLRPVRSAGFFAITSLGYQERYLVDVLARRDGSSLFGEEERWQNYLRFSGAWRMTEESWWPFEWVDEFKPRYSIGTAGGRPSFEAQYQTYAVDRGQISPQILGNPNLRPEFATEREAGFDAVFLGERLAAQFSYVSTTIEDQILLTPLQGYYGFSAQWRNAGTLESRTWEARLDGAIIERPNLAWTSFVNFDRTTNLVSELHVPNFVIRHLRSTMWVVEGEPLGSYFGKRWASSCDDLPATANCGDFDVNDDGYLVYVGAGNNWQDGFAKQLWGTTGESGGQSYDWGRPFADQAWPEMQKIGDSQPDFALGWGNTLRWGNLSANLLFQGEFGPEIYSTTQQWESTSGVPTGAQHDEGFKPEERQKPVGYYFTLYDVNINNDHWVRDGTYVKLRELSLRYTFPREHLERLLGTAASPDRISVNVVGRNLLTWTDYTGYDPEVGRSDFLGSAVVGRIDEYSYPNFRSVGLDVEVVF